MSASLKNDLFDLPVEDLAHLAAEAEWKSTRRVDQTPPPGDWDIWLYLAGRGSGKTRAASETLRSWAWEQPNTRWLVSAPTFANLREVCFEGDSGLINVVPRELLIDGPEYYSKTLMELRFKNGSLIKGIAAEEPNRFRGPQFHGGWLDELAAWNYPEEAWDMLMMGMRLGQHPRIIATTTPKPKPLIRSLVERNGKDVVITTSSSYANRANLAPTFFNQLAQYEGTQLGRQEIYAELLDPEEYGVIKRSWFEVWPANEPLPAFDYVVMSLDTAFTEATIDKKSGDRDPTACSVWGLFQHKSDDEDDDRRSGIMLLNCWEDQLGLPDLVARVRKEMKIGYGTKQAPAIKMPALVGTPYLSKPSFGHKPDLVLIEDKGSGISLRQTMAREGIYTYPYNPGRANKITRLHAVSHIFSNRMVWAPESTKRPGQIVNWADKLISQLCSFTGEGSIKHDDYVDSTTQAIRLLIDRNMISVAMPKPENFDSQKDYSADRPVNPYAR